MPFPFTLPTASTLSFTAHFESPTHPSLPTSASTRRAHLRHVLKAHKRQPPTSQAANLPNVLSSLEAYIPYLLTLDAGQSINSPIDVVLTSTPSIEWRPILTASSIPGREPPRVKLNSLEYEIYFTLSTLATVHHLLARSALQPLYNNTTASPSPEARTSAITSATKSLLAASSIHAYLSSRSESLPSQIPSLDISPPVFKALSELALAEATLLAVTKDDPYPAALAQERNKSDKEWMIKAPTMAKVRAHLFARLCLASSAHAATAASLLCEARSGKQKIEEDLVAYCEDAAKVGKAKACRFLGVDADLGARTGEGIAWLRAGKSVLGMVAKEGDEESKKGGLGSWKTKWSEKREEKKVEKGRDWGADAGKSEEGRVLLYLEGKWGKENDTISTQSIPPHLSLLTTLPSGREMYTIAPYNPPVLSSSELISMEAPPSPVSNDADSGDSTDEEKEPAKVLGAMPGTEREYGSSSGIGYY